VLAGWAVSLMMTLLGAILRRALSKAARGKQFDVRTPHRSPQDEFVKPSPKPEAGSQPFRQWKIQDTIFQGMDKAALIAAYGEPYDRRLSAGREIWMYHTPSMTVTLDQGIVTDWIEEDLRHG
jgi:hypothetical protein